MRTQHLLVGFDSSNFFSRHPGLWELTVAAAQYRKRLEVARALNRMKSDLRWQAAYKRCLDIFSGRDVPVQRELIALRAKKRARLPLEGCLEANDRVE